MKQKLALLASSAMVALATITPAQAGNFYVTVMGGVNWMDDVSAALAVPATPTSTFAVNAESDTGYLIGGAVGMSLSDWAPGLRAEVELAYRHNQADGVFVSNTLTTPGWSGPVDMDHSTFSVMANVWYDFAVGGVKPYIGGGIGWARSNLDGTFAPVTATGVYNFDEDDGGFAWQFGAGVNFDIGPKTQLGVGYRYLQGPEVTLPSPSAIYSGGHSLATDVDSDNHSLVVNVTHKL